MAVVILTFGDYFIRIRSSIDVTSEFTSGFPSRYHGILDKQQSDFGPWKRWTNLQGLSPGFIGKNHNLNFHLDGQFGVHHLHYLQEWGDADLLSRKKSKWWLVDVQCAKKQTLDMAKCSSNSTYRDTTMSPCVFFLCWKTWPHMCFAGKSIGFK